VACCFPRGRKATACRSWRRWPTARPVFASDLPIHREVGGSGCTFFPADAAADLAAAVTAHEALHAGVAVPPRVVEPPLTWQDAADRLLDAIAEHRGIGAFRHAG